MTDKLIPEIAELDIDEKVQALRYRVLPQKWRAVMAILTTLSIILAINQIFNLGFFVGYELPAMVRFWGNYVFNLEGVDDDNSNNKLTDGSGMVFGVGFKAVSFISLNFEISNLKTTKAEWSGVESDMDADYNTYTLGVSFPFSI